MKNLTIIWLLRIILCLGLNENFMMYSKYNFFLVYGMNKLKHPQVLEFHHLTHTSLEAHFINNSGVVELGVQGAHLRTQCLGNE